MNLFYREMGEGKPFMILHGLFGYSDNWQSHAKKLSEYYRVILVDLRNHGRSPWAESNTYDEMAGDVYQLVERLELKDLILMGHSMGGKVAMRYAQLHEDTLERLIVVDIGVKEYPLHHDRILEGIQAVGSSGINSRSKADEIMQHFIESFSVRQFLLKNLYWKDKTTLSWRMNVDVIANTIQQILVKLPEQEVFTPTLFIRGHHSGYILDEDVQELEHYFPDSDLISIEKAGHWVHAEAPEEFIGAVLAFCLR